MTGFAFLASTISLQITSEAKIDPPGEFTRSTIALMASSFLALRISLANFSELITPSTSPSTISPSATITAMRFEEVIFFDFAIEPKSEALMVGMSSSSPRPSFSRSFAWT